MDFFDQEWGNPYRMKENSAELSVFIGRPRLPRIVHDQTRKTMKAMRVRISNANMA